MNVNHFFTAAAFLLIGIFVLIRPMQIDRPADQQIPELDLKTFTVYELDREGLVRVMFGDEGQRFKERYEVKNIAYSDSRGSVTQDMTAHTGTYEEGIVTLSGEVVIRRSDGIDIKAEEASYDQNEGIVRSHGAFYMSDGSNRAQGRDFVYYTNKNRVKAVNVKASYKMPDKGANP
jgi:LPS export ABC transporter protein LptC